MRRAYIVTTILFLSLNSHGQVITVTAGDNIEIPLENIDASIAIQYLKHEIEMPNQQTFSEGYSEKNVEWMVEFLKTNDIEFTAMTPEIDSVGYKKGKVAKRKHHIRTRFIFQLSDLNKAQLVSLRALSKEPTNILFFEDGILKIPTESDFITELYNKVLIKAEFQANQIGRALKRKTVYIKEIELVSSYPTAQVTEQWYTLQIGNAWINSKEGKHPLPLIFKVSYNTSEL